MNFVALDCVTLMKNYFEIIPDKNFKKIKKEPKIYFEILPSDRSSRTVVQLLKAWQKFIFKNFKFNKTNSRESFSINQDMKRS